MIRKKIIDEKVDRPFKFDPALATFTPSMAKRNSAAPFAAGVMVQGNVAGTVGDVLTASTGTAIKNYFYSNYDSYQGSVVFWITPEWNGNDGLSHGLFGDQYGGYNLYILKYITNVLILYVGNKLITVDVSSWTAGTTYCIVARWDSKNTIDGTNYISLSINDSHTFGGTSALPVTTPYPNLTIGAKSGGGLVSNAIIEGLTVYRRVLFDGTYGKDIGNGDELALIYNAGAGKDPTEITGSWDVVFCLPTNATAGALVTGTGEAWSHPHSSNLLKDGWLADGYYGGGDYAVKSTSSGSGYVINRESGASLDNLAAGAYTYELWVNTQDLIDNYSCLLAKSFGSQNKGWALQWYSGRLRAIIVTDGGQIYATVGAADSAIVNNGKWHHIAVTYDASGDKIIRVYLDGKVCALSDAITGTPVDDSGYTFAILSDAQGVRTIYGDIGWTRISNSIRYTTDFVPSSTPPAVDGNTVAQWNMVEGTGTSVADESGNGNTGTITNGTWTPVWKPTGTPVLPKSVALGTSITAPAETSINNLHSAAFTYEGYLNLDKSAADFYFGRKGTVLSTGWDFRVYNGTIAIDVMLGSAVTVSYAPINIFTKTWHHFAFTWDYSDDKKIRLFIDGVLVATSNAGSGTAVDDSASALTILKGIANTASIGWVRISNNIRYTANFTPPSRFAPPANDANTVRLFKMDEGVGTTITDSSTNAQNATLSNGTWNNTPDMATDSPGARVFNWGHVLGSDAVDEGLTQKYTGATAGSDYVLRALCHSGIDRLGKPKVTVWDDTNDAEITTIKGDWSRERVVNGGFDSDTLWTKGIGWSISGGTANCDGSQSTYSALVGLSYSNGGVEIGKRYKVSFEVLNYSAGLVRVNLGSFNTGYKSANGSYTAYITSDVTVVTVTATADFIGSIDNVSVTPVSEVDKPEPLICSFELPTIARAGVAADCTSFSVKLLNEADAGEVAWHQVELLPNLLDNPSFEYGSGDPWIPTGWTNSGLDAGEGVEETTIIHSTGSSFKFVGGDVGGEGIYKALSILSGAFVSVGGFVRNVSAGISLYSISGYYSPGTYHQRTASTNINLPNSYLYWTHLSCVGRASANNSTLGSVAGGIDRYLDDLYAIALDDVSLTATPASLANSQESGGIRVDGLDKLSMFTTSILKPTSGVIKFKFILRHNIGDVIKFNSGLVLFSLYADSNNRIDVSTITNNNLICRYMGSGVNVSSDVNVTGLIVAGSLNSFEIKYTSSKCIFKLNGVAIKELTGISPIIIPTNSYIYFGSNGAPVSQADAVFLP